MDTFTAPPASSLLTTEAVVLMRAATTVWAHSDRAQHVIRVPEPRHKRLEVVQPVLTNADLEKIRSIHELVDGTFRTATIDITWDAAEGAPGLKAAIERIRVEATEHVLQDSNILILSDRAVSEDRIPVPALLALSAVHHKLVRQGLRMQTGLVVETGEAREVHHFCTLAGYGAEAVNTYLAFETL